MLRCSICKLPSEQRIVIERALREQLPLQVISDRMGLSKSSIWRHGRQHLKQTAPEAPPPAENTAPEPSTVAPAPKPAARMLQKRRQGDQIAVAPNPELDADRQKAFERSEFLWSEFCEGLEASKKTIPVTRPDGSTFELPGDLRARAAFLRVGRDTLGLDAELRGLLDAQARGVTVNVLAVIMSPKCEGVEPAAEGASEGERPAIDIQPES